MAYIGRSPQYGVFHRQTLTPDGLETTYALDYGVASASSMLVSVGGVLQQPDTAYSIQTGGTEIVFSEAPDNGAETFIVYLGEKIDVPEVPDGSITTVKLAATGVTANTYGGSSQIPVITIGVDGRVTAAANTSITLGSMATQDSSSVTITGGTIVGLTNLAGANATFTGNVDSGGIVTAVDFNSTSDITLKENIQPISNPLEVLNQMHGIQFNWKSSGARSYGLSAQEVENVLPDIVKERTDGYKGINYSNIIAFLIEAIKDLNTQVQQLKNK